MRRRWFLAALGALTAATAAASLALAGCSETPADVEPSHDAGGEGDAPGATEDAAHDEDSSADARADADPDATDADAGPRCTADGWCHTALPTDAGTLSLSDVSANRDEAWAVSAEGHVLHWQDGAWSVVWKAEVPLAAVQRTHDGAVWAVGKGGSIFRHTAGDAIGAWTSIPSGTGMDLLGICEGATSATSPQNLWIAGQQTILLHWSGGGDPSSPAWSPAALGPIENRGIRCATDGVWAVGLDLTNYGTALYHVESETAWTQKKGLPTTQFGRPFSAVWAFGESDLWMANIHKIVHGPGAGAPSWTSYDVGDWYVGSPMDWDIWSSASNDVWIVGRHGRIYHFDGTALKLSITSIDGVILANNLHGISGESADDLWVVGDGVALHRKTHP